MTIKEEQTALSKLTAIKDVQPEKVICRERFASAKKKIIKNETEVPL